MKPKNKIVCYIPILNFIEGEWSMCQIGDTGHLGSFTH